MPDSQLEHLDLQLLSVQALFFLDLAYCLQLLEPDSQPEHLDLQLLWLLHFVLVPQEVLAFGLQPRLQVYLQLRLQVFLQLRLQLLMRY